MPEMYEQVYSYWREGYNDETVRSVDNVLYQVDMQQEERQKFKQIGSTLKKVDKQQLQQQADRIIEQQKQGDASATSQEMEKIREKARVNGIEINIYSLEFLIAESLQRIDASEDPQAEYFDWVEHQQKIEQNINFGGVTEDELKARNMFLDFLDAREAEMKRIIALYSGAALHGSEPLREEAISRLKFLEFKWSELRRLRAKTEATQNYADTKSKEEKAIEQVPAFASRVLAEAHDQYFLQREGITSQEFERGAAERLVKFRPVTMSREAAEAKIKKARANYIYMAKILTGLRYGKSFEEQEREEIEEELIERDRRLRMFELNGFTREQYRRLIENVRD